MSENTNLYTAISGLYDGLNKLNTKANNTGTTLSGALEGYLSASAVSNKFTSVDSRLDSLESAGGNSALTGLVAGNGIQAITVSDHSATIAVSSSITDDIAALKQVAAGYSGDNAISTAISNSLTSAKEYTDTLSTAVFVGADSLSSTLRSSIDTNTSNISTNATAIAANASDITTLSTALSGYTGENAVSSKFAGIDAKLDGISTTVTGYVDDQITKYNLTEALTGVVDPVDVIQLGTNDVHQITGKFLYNEDQFKVESNKLGLNIQLSAITTADGDAKTYALVDNKGNKLGADINIAKDQFLSGVEFIEGTGSADDKLKFTFELTNNTPKTIEVPLSGLFNEYEKGNGIDLTASLTGITISAVKASASENFLYIDSTGIGLSGVQTAINTAATNAKNDVLTGVLSGYTANGSVKEAIDAAKKAGDDAQADVDSLENKLSAAFVADKVVLGAADGITSSAYTIGLSGVSKDDEMTSFGGENKLATEKAVKEWVNYNLESLITSIATLNASI